MVFLTSKSSVESVGLWLMLSLQVIGVGWRTGQGFGARVFREVDFTAEVSLLAWT